MIKKTAHENTYRDEAAISPLPYCGDPFSLAMHLLRKGLFHGQYETTLHRAPEFSQVEELLRYLEQVQHHLAGLARGNISSPVPLDGYTGALLREMQENLHHVTWQARQLTVGDFSCDAGCMGELSEAFTVMGKTLQAAMARLEQQKQDLTALSENLRREVEARAAMEKDLRREQARLQKLASTDPLTGIANRRYFFQAAVRELERIRRTKAPACLAMLDIDHFKALNDSLGHNAGDKALRQITKIITSVVRPYDVVGRYGGDEFIFLFPEISRDQAHALLERLRGAVEKAVISAGKGNPDITVSIGLIELEAEKKISGNTLDAIIKRADEALYTAKKQCRNHICIL
ncbi:putative Response regulator PleD [uncultured delta proteobacterium]|uniref:Putative Response regulator PleD n=1 Tax=uncultured delta proteobacterium TaxID=34034 RepID=A0A212JE58_9DELT|nr:putative Response regulator PleD [uncultured delta proteobacterium]